MKHIKKFNESIVDFDAYDIIKKSKTFKKLIRDSYTSEEDFINDLEIELTELDFGNTDVIRAAETIYRENE